jgi:hypothetical protein
VENTSPEPSAFSLVMKTSVAPLRVAWAALAVGKFGELVFPVTYASPTKIHRYTQSVIRPTASDFVDRHMRMYRSPCALHIDVVAALVLGCLQSSADRIGRGNCG